MGLFDGLHVKKAKEFYDRAKGEKDPEKKKELLIKSVLEDYKTSTMNRAKIRELLFGENVARDLDAVRRLLDQCLFLKAGRERQRLEDLKDIEELERLGFGEVGSSRYAVRNFLTAAAGKGSALAIEYGLDRYGWRDFGELCRQAALRGNALMAHKMEDRLYPWSSRKKDNNEMGCIGGAEYAFWKQFAEELDAGREYSEEEAVNRWKAAREGDETEEDRLAHIVKEKELLKALMPKASDDDGWRSPELLECFCNWFWDMASLNLRKKGKPVPKVLPPSPGGEAEKLFQEGRIEERLGRNYWRVKELYSQAAELGHAEAAGRLADLCLWLEGENSKWEERARECGWLPASRDADERIFGYIQLARVGDLDGLEYLVRSLRGRQDGEPKEEDKRRSGLFMDTKKPWGAECRLAIRIYRAIGENRALQGDLEAAFLMADEIGYDDKELTKQYARQCLEGGYGRAYYKAAVDPSWCFIDRLDWETRYAMAELASLAGAPRARDVLAGQRKHTEASIEEGRRQSQELRRQYAELVRQRETAQREQAVRQVMEEYQERSAWAERAASAALGGSGVTLEESYALGEIDLDRYGTAQYIRNDLEEKHRRKVEAEYDAAHGRDE